MRLEIRPEVLEKLTMYPRWLHLAKVDFINVPLYYTKDDETKFIFTIRKFK